MNTSSPNFAADSIDIPDQQLSAYLIETFCKAAAGPATLSNGTPQASLAGVNSPGIAPDDAPAPNWTPLLSFATDGHPQIAADSNPIPNEMPPLSFSMSGPQIVYHVGNLDLDEEQLRQIILTTPAGQEVLELYKLYIRAKKYLCRQIRFDIDLIKSLGLYDKVNAKIGPVLMRAESNLLEWGTKEDLLNRDPRAKSFAKIARNWGAFVCDYFRCSKGNEHNMRAIASAAESVPDYTLARRLANENILVRLEQVTGSNYRQKRYATIKDWYGIRSMASIYEPIDPMRLFAIGMHLGEYDVMEEGIL